MSLTYVADAANLCLVVIECHEPGICRDGGRICWSAGVIGLIAAWRGVRGGLFPYGASGRTLASRMWTRLHLNFISPAPDGLLFALTSDLQVLFVQGSSDSRNFVVTTSLT